MKTKTNIEQVQAAVGATLNSICSSDLTGDLYLGLAPVTSSVIIVLARADGTCWVMDEDGISASAAVNAVDACHRMGAQELNLAAFALTDSTAHQPCGESSGKLDNETWTVIRRKALELIVEMSRALITHHVAPTQLAIETLHKVRETRGVVDAELAGIEFNIDGDGTLNFAYTDKMIDIDFWPETGRGVWTVGINGRSFDRLADALDQARKEARMSPQARLIAAILG